MAVNAQFPEKLSFLFQPMRYKVARGGRGSGKSWSFARALLIQGAASPLLILCTREVQKSIKDSVHKLLTDQIQALSLGSFYEVLRDEIRGRNGTRFIFAGLSELTVESIKSLEGCDRVWCEEAQAITKRSWDVLIPTIRKDGSEIWISYNPELETDPTHQRYTVKPPEDCISVLVNYQDNPWFPDVLEKERRRCQLVDPDNYENIWEGKCKPAVEGAIYYKQMAAAEVSGQIRDIPYDPTLKVHVVFDLGWNDAMAISLVQRVRSEIRVIEYIEDSHKTLEQYDAELRTRKHNGSEYNWGKVFLPHDGYSGDIKTGKSSAEILRALGWSVPAREDIVELGLEEGIKATRAAFANVYFDKSGTERLVECLKRYRRTISAKTQEAGAPLHDQFSHGADNFRYVCINAEKMTNDSAEMFKKTDLKFTDIRPNTLNVYVLAYPPSSKNKDSGRTAIVAIGVDASNNKYLIDGYCHKMDLPERWTNIRNLRRHWASQPGVQAVHVGYEWVGLRADLTYFEERMRATNDSFTISELKWTDGPTADRDRIQRLVPEFLAGRFYLTSLVTKEVDGKPVAAESAAQARCREQGEPWRILKPVKRKDHEGNLYSLNALFLTEYLGYPFSMYKDILDTCSRLYDIGYVPPIIIDQAMLEPECE